MLGNRLESMEAGVLFNRFAFEVAKVKLIVSEIDAENHSALGYSLNLGGVHVGETIDSKTGRKMVISHATPQGFYKVLPKLEKTLVHFKGRL